MTSTPSSPGMTPGSPATVVTSAHDSGPSRIFSLDVLRGIAVLGILIISIWEFGGFTTNKQTFFRTGTHGGNYDLLSWVSILFEGKMRALFALVFGAGIILFMQKKDHPSTLSNPDLYIKRQMWLILFGIFNAVILLWPGDILFHYGVIGILLFAFWRMPARGLLIASIIVTLIYCAKNYWNYSDDRKVYKKYLVVKDVEKKFEKDSIEKHKKDSLAGLLKKDSAVTPVVKDTTKTGTRDSLSKTIKTDTLTKEQKKDKDAWENMVKSAKYDSSGDKNANKAMRTTSYPKLWNHLLGRTQYKESYWLYQVGLWDIASIMLLGMALLGFGFFQRFTTKKYLLIAIPCIIIGILLAWFRNEQHAARLMDYAKYIDKNPVPHNQFFPIERMLLVLGYASLIMALLHLNIFSRIWRTLSTVGKMALTNYFLQTILCTIFFYGYGMGYYGRLTQLQLYFVVLEMWLIQIVFSVLWLRFYTMGPVEWLWRWLTYGKKLPIKKNRAEEAVTTATTATN